jgi:hypothetical protein
VIDYKTGKRQDMTDISLKGGSELQRCLYAFAVKTLLGHSTEVDAALLYVRTQQGEKGLFPLTDVEGALQVLSDAIKLARSNIENGLSLPGIDVDQHNDLALALPASPSYLARKKQLAKEMLGEATRIWEAK